MMPSGILDLFMSRLLPTRCIGSQIHALCLPPVSTWLLSVEEEGEQRGTGGGPSHGSFQILSTLAITGPMDH